MIDVSALSVTTGVVSALLVLPAALSLSFLFRLRAIKLTCLETHQKNDSSEGEILQHFPQGKLSWNAYFSAKVQLYGRNITHHGFISTGFLCHFSSQMFFQQLIVHLSSLP